MVWDDCVNCLERELSSRDFATWIRPLQASADGATLRILAPNPYVCKHVSLNFLARIRELVELYGEGSLPLVQLDVGDLADASPRPLRSERANASQAARREGGLDPRFTFDLFVEGRSNEMARAASLQAASEPPGQCFSPLALYGGTGLGKTHLMHAIGNKALLRNPRIKVCYVHSQQFVKGLVGALRKNAMQKFAQRYRKVDVLLIDDIQFFANKAQSQDEFFHVFNSLHQQDHQLVLTCDRYPVEVEGLEERLKSRFVSGLSVELDPPNLETRAAILLKKAEHQGFDLDDDVAFYMAENIRSNVRELEGALQRVQAHISFSGAPTTKAVVGKILGDMFAVHHRQVSIDRIQSVVAEYFNIRRADLLGHRRTRSVVRPRQMAMALAKELTKHSLPEIGREFGGRDHTTVLHACSRMKALRANYADVAEDYRNVSRKLMR